MNKNSEHGDLARCSSLLVYDTFETKGTEKVVFAKESTNLSSDSSQIDLSSLTHSVP